MGDAMSSLSSVKNKSSAKTKKKGKSKEVSEGNISKSGCPIGISDEEEPPDKCHCELFDGQPCLDRFSVNIINTYRDGIQNLSRTELDIILLGKISSCINMTPGDSPSTYSLHGYDICRRSFKYLHYTSQNKLTKLIKWYKANGLVMKQEKKESPSKVVPVSHKSQSEVIPDTDMSNLITLSNDIVHWPSNVGWQTEFSTDIATSSQKSTCQGVKKPVSQVMEEMMQGYFPQPNMHDFSSV